MGKLVDLTGQRFGRLVVLYRAKNNICNRPAWHCKCDCGNEKDIAGNSLRHGDTKSCGCYNKEQISKTNAIHLYPEQKFGHWTVLEEIDKRKNKYIMYKCKCDCGNEKIVSGHALRSGNSQSCGKCLRNNIIGKTYGLLTILSVNDEKTNEKNLYVNCRCVCGNITIVQYGSLKNGGTKSCGCLHESFGEYQINKILLENHIPFKRQHTFKDCYFSDSQHLAQFDFYVDNKYIIEFDGKQHFYKSCEFFENGFEYTREHDLIKDRYCFCNHIPLIRIPFTHENKIILKDLLLETSDFILEGDDQYFSFGKTLSIL